MLSKKSYWLVACLACLFLSTQVAAQQSDPFADMFTEEPDFLAVDQAFQFEFTQKDNDLVLSWTVADGYYLYKKQFKTVVKNAELAEPQFPQSEQIEDEFFGVSDIFRQQVNITYPIIQSIQDGVVKIQYQGCADAGLCYPPTVKVVYLDKTNSQFLPVEKAFAYDFTQENDTLSLSWKIADGYYLYKDSIEIIPAGAALKDLELPPAISIVDKFKGPTVGYRGEFKFQSKIITVAEQNEVQIQFQGCADDGICYPVQSKILTLQKLNSADVAENISQIGTSLTSEHFNENESTSNTVVSQQFELADLLASDQSLTWSLFLFFLLGIGLAFTPCVFPMYPILSGIVIGQGKTISTSKAFSLSFIYVQGMALTYSILGLVVASAGVQFQATLQHPAILITLITLFVLLAIVMFGAYELQMPSSWQEKLNAMSNKQKSGSYIGVFVMGAISGLVASPCTTAPLTGILLFIAQSGDLLLGFTALYALSLGMGIPLILFGITGGKLLPKAGNWMNIVKVTFGFMMLAVALIFVERLQSYVPVLVVDIAWTVLGLACFTYFFVMNQDSKVSFLKGLRTLLIFVGLMASGFYGYSTITPLFAHQAMPGVSQQQSAVTPHPDFVLIKSLDDFNAKLAAANAQGKSVMLDLYADWCVACKEFEKFTFPAPAVVDALSNTVWMQIDLTDNTPVNLSFQDYFSILGLPTILFFNQQGEELKSARVTGFMKAEPFADHVNQVFN
ncbi:protein-disulfide reductase DsbD [Paraglaciecola sp. 25GB23A]|uniref:protein-disulfide reductase DsbD n=1 Tax=Paraglaciecola sp. 25GB23A TaxID=3156068 RepID=UPI0032AEA182